VTAVKGQARAFEAAFDRLLRGLRGDLLRFAIYRPRIIKMAQLEGSYEAGGFVRQVIPASDWEWPEYDRQFPPEEDDPEYNYLYSLSLKELRPMAGTRAKGRSVEALVDAMALAIPADEFERLSRAAEATVRQREAVAAYRDRTQMFAHRLSMLGFSLASRQRQRESLQYIPDLKVKFMCGDSISTPKRCRLMDRKVFEIDSREYATLGPCERMDCGCCWTASSNTFKSTAGP